MGGGDIRTTAAAIQSTHKNKSTTSFTPRHNNMTTMATLIFSDGKKYDGEFKDGKKNGKGVETQSDGTTYDGMWKDGLPHGKGVATWPGETTYDGEWTDGMRNGNGVMKTPSFGGTTYYDGMWTDGLPNGDGMIKMTNDTGVVLLTFPWKDDNKMECQNCNQSIPGLINCGCSFNHRFCEDCCANLNASCTTCEEPIEVEMCEICMKYSADHTIMNCGNEHQICTACFTLIRDTTATCPFCRKRIS